MDWKLVSKSTIQNIGYDALAPEPVSELERSSISSVVQLTLQVNGFLILHIESTSTFRSSRHTIPKGTWSPGLEWISIARTRYMPNTGSLPEASPMHLTEDQFSYPTSRLDVLP